MNWRWAPHVFAVMHEQDLVLLDARADSYLVLADGDEAVSLSSDGGRAQIGDRELTHQLSDAGLGEADERPGLPRRRAPPATDDLEEAQEVDPSLREVLSLAAAAFSLFWSFRFRRFGALTASADHGPASLGSAVAKT